MLIYNNHIVDMKDCRKSSKLLQVAHIGLGSIYSSIDLKKVEFIGILSCKEPNETE